MKVPRGWSFCPVAKKKCEMKEGSKTEGEYEGDEEEESPEERTRREVIRMFSDINEDLRFTLELQGDFIEEKIPTLDCKIWMDELYRVRYGFYEKEMAYKLCIKKQTALPEQLKKSVLTAEIARRLQSIDRYSETKDQVEEINRFELKITRSGYCREERKRVIEDAVIGHHRKIQRCTEMNLPTHRDGSKGVMDRRMKKLGAKTAWYKKKKRTEESNKQQRGGNKKNIKEAQDMLEPASIFFVNRTPGGELASRLRSAEEKMEGIFTRRIKIVQKPGAKLKDSIVNANPWNDKKCGCPRCIPCEQAGDKPSKCKTRSILYSNTCTICKIKGKDVVYIGESSRSGAERCLEHHRDSKWESKKEKSHMELHRKETHPELEEGRWKFKV